MTILGKMASAIEPRLDPFIDPTFHSLFRANPFVIYDGGAAGRVFLPHGIPLCEMIRVYGFEPVPDAAQRLETRYADHPQVTIKRVALAQSDGSAAFYIRKDQPTVSSLLADSRLDQETEQITVESVRLDGLPTRFDIPRADFIKLDTEGTELEILEGGREMLSSDVLGVFVEISFWRQSAKAAVFHQVDRCLTGLGFVLFDLQINRAHFSGVGGKKDKPRGGDALYLRNFAALFERNPNAPQDWLRTKLLKLIAFCAAWRYLEYAIELLNYGHERGLLNDEEFARLAKRYASIRDVSAWIPEFPGRRSLARVCDFLSYALHDTARKGVPASFNSIGNAWPFAIPAKTPSKVTIQYPVLAQGKEHETTVVLDRTTDSNLPSSRGAT